MPIDSRNGLLKKRAVWATGVIAALAVAAPVAAASADPTPAPSLPALGDLPAFGELPAFGQLPAIDGLPALEPVTVTPPSIPGVAVGATVIGAVTNGPTAVCVSPVSCVTNTSP
jgi:hypothetical protein